MVSFTVEILSGFCNVLKSLVTALSIGDTNLLPRTDCSHYYGEGGVGGDFREILDDSLICHGNSEMGESFISARFLILKEEEKDQQDLINDTKVWGSDLHGGINIINKNILHLFSAHTIDWFYDRTLICDKVFNRIQTGIEKVKWRDLVLNEVKNIIQQFEGNILTIQIRTWRAHHIGDIKDLTNRKIFNDGVIRDYNFETYKNAIDKFLSETKTIFLTADCDDALTEYMEYLKNYKVIIYTQPSHITHLQYSAATMLIASHCNMLVCSRISTFAECIWWFGGCKAKVIPVF